MSANIINSCNKIIENKKNIDSKIMKYFSINLELRKNIK